MRARRLAPTLLMLAAMPMAVAAEGVAPVFGAPESYFQGLSSAPAKVLAPGSPPPIQINLDDSKFTNGLFYFIAGQYGSGFFSPFGTSTNRGIAVVGTGGVSGTWYYNLGNSGWNELIYTSEYGAQLLALSPGFSMGSIALGFRPAANAVTSGSGEATLTFRAVDDITAADDTLDLYNYNLGDLVGSPYNSNSGMIGGSPSPYSAETRTITVNVTAENDAPVWNGDSYFSRTIQYDTTVGGQAIDIPVSTLVGSSFAAGSDPDGFTDLGVLISYLDPGCSYFRVFPNNSTEAISLNNTEGILLGPNEMLRVKPLAGLDLGSLTVGNVRLWDGTGEFSAGDVFSTVELATGGSEPFSDTSDYIYATLAPNSAPSIDTINDIIVYRPGIDTSIATTVVASDGDSQIEDIGFATEGGIIAENRSDFATGINAVWGGLSSSSSNPPATTASRNLSFTNLPNQTGEIATFAGIYAIDDVGVRSFSANFTLYGNSAPQWSAGAIASGTSLTVAEDGSLAGLEFAVSDPDIDTPFTGFNDYLSFGGELDSLPTEHKGVVTVTLNQFNPNLDAPGLPALEQAFRIGGNTYWVTVGYTPDEDFNGTDTVTIPIQDSLGLSPAVPLVLNFTVIPVNDPPVANATLPNSPLTVSQGQVATFTLSATDPDAGDQLTWSPVGASTLGTVAISSDPGANQTVTFTAKQAIGEETLTFRVTDLAGASSTVSVPVQVIELEVAPVITTPAPVTVSLAPEGSTTIALAATDPNLGEVLTWSVAQDSPLVTIDPPQGPGSNVTFTIRAGQQTGTGTALLRVMDSTERVATIPVSITVATPGNQPPTITAPDAGTNLGEILGGTSRAFVARATDPDAGDTLTWSIATQPTKGSLSPTSGTGASVSFLYTAGLLATGADSFEVQVADSRGGSARVVVNASVIPNTPPDVSTPIGVSETQNGTVVAVAVRGQPFRTLIGGDDQETPRTVAVTITGTLPSGIVFNSTGNSGVLAGTPTTAGSFNFSIALDDGVNRTITPVQLTVVEPVTASVASPTIPVSTPDRTAYGSFLPGSAENFTALATALAGRQPSQTRAFWWNATSQAYAELPTLPAAGTEAWHAVWLASTTPISLPSTITAVAMPYAVDLAPGWTFFGVPPVTDGTTVSTTHAWANFQVQSDTGVPLSSTQRASALGNADAGGPFAWDGASYARTTNLVTGSGYWLKNASGASLRLVRTATAISGSLSLRSAAVRSDEQPPAPPGGETTQATEEHGGCGAGSGIGLFGLSMAFLFARLRRRR